MLRRERGKTRVSRAVCQKPGLSACGNPACQSRCFSESLRIKTLALSQPLLVCHDPCLSQPCVSQTMSIDPCLSQTQLFTTLAFHNPCLSQLQLGSQPLPVTTPACHNPCLSEIQPVTTPACQRPSLSQPLPVTTPGCHHPCLSQHLPVTTPC